MNDENQLENGEEIVNKFAYANGININGGYVELQDGGKTYTAKIGDVAYNLNIKTHPDMTLVQEITDQFLGFRENRVPKETKEQERQKTAYIA